MGFALLLGCSLIAFSPPAALTVLVVNKAPILVALAIASAGAWLSSLLATGLCWSFVPALKASSVASAVLGTLAQEVARGGLVLGHRKFKCIMAGNPGARPALVLSDPASALACGCGFGTMHSLVNYGSLLSASVDPDAVLYLDSCPRVPLVLVCGG